MNVNCHDCHTTPSGKCARHDPKLIELKCVEKALKPWAKAVVAEYNRVTEATGKWFKRGVEAMRGSKP